MIKLEKTTKTNLKAKGLQIQNGSVVEIETGEIINLNNIILNSFGDSEFDFQVTTSTKEESEVDTEVTEDDFDGREY